MIVRSNLTKQGCKSLNQDKKSLKMPTGQSEAVNQGQTIQWPNKSEQTMIYETITKH
jgi:hypothetical protein